MPGPLLGSANARALPALDASAGLTERDPTLHAGVPTALWVALSVVMARLLAEHPAAAYDVLAPLSRIAEGAALPWPVTASFLADEVEALVALGEVEPAHRLTVTLEAHRERGRWPEVLALRSRALVQAARGELERAERTSMRAVARCAGLSGAVETGRTCLVAGRIARRRKHKAVARELIERAARLFEEAGCDALLDRATAEAARLGDRQADVLTATERQVATLSASGLTNRGVAARLGISPKTVEANLSRVYRKLGIRSRAELGARLGHEGLVVAPRGRETPDSSPRASVPG